MKNITLATTIALLLLAGAFMSAPRDFGLQAGGLPDLAANLTVNPAACWFCVGNDVRPAVQLTVQNRGDVDIEHFSVKLVLSKAPLGAISFPYNLQPGSYLIGNVDVNTILKSRSDINVGFPTVQLPDSIDYGTYFFTAILDPDNQVQENDKNNNYAQSRVSIQIYTDDNVQIAGSSPPYWSIHGKGFGPWKPTLTAKTEAYTIPISAADWTPNLAVIRADGIVPVRAEYYIIELYDKDRVISRRQSIKWGICARMISPAAGSPGSIVDVICWNNPPQQGNITLALRKNGSYVADLTVLKWGSGHIMARVPAVAPGSYLLFFMIGKSEVTGAPVMTFTVN